MSNPSITSTLHIADAQDCVGLGKITATFPVFPCFRREKSRTGIAWRLDSPPPSTIPGWLPPPWRGEGNAAAQPHTWGGVCGEVRHAQLGRGRRNRVAGSLDAACRTHPCLGCSVKPLGFRAQGISHAPQPRDILDGQMCSGRDGSSTHIPCRRNVPLGEQRRDKPLFGGCQCDGSLCPLVSMSDYDCYSLTQPQHAGGGEGDSRLLRVSAISLTTAQTVEQNELSRCRLLVFLFRTLRSHVWVTAPPAPGLCLLCESEHGYCSGGLLGSDACLSTNSGSEWLELQQQN